MFRDLYFQILEYKGDRLCEAMLLPSLDGARTAMSDLAPFRELGPVGQRPEDMSASWELYALGRINDLLLLTFQADERGGWERPLLSKMQYLDFFMRLGMTPFTCKDFSPIYFEIVKVEQATDPAEPIRVVEHFWPGLAFGDMIFSRSGVRVTGGTDHVVKEVAEASTLYFTHWRLHRKTNDLSLGWGSNSQWRTDFRRDYAVGGKFYYHCQGKTLIGQGPDEEDRDRLTDAERVELCRNRCFIRARTTDDSDLWPYDDRWEE